MNASQAVREAVASVSGRRAAEVTDDKRLTEDFGIRSLARVELAALIEEKLGRVVDDKDVRSASTVGDLVGRLQGGAA